MHVGKNYTGNERFYGFCVDILERLSLKIGFNYIIGKFLYSIFKALNSTLNYVFVSEFEALLGTTFY